jgi:hypothetical protein
VMYYSGWAWESRSPARSSVELDQEKSKVLIFSDVESETSHDRKNINANLCEHPTSDGSTADMINGVSMSEQHISSTECGQGQGYTRSLSVSANNNSDVNLKDAPRKDVRKMSVDSEAADKCSCFSDVFEKIDQFWTRYFQTVPTSSGLLMASFP